MLLREVANIGAGLMEDQRDAPSSSAAPRWNIGVNGGYTAGHVKRCPLGFGCEATCRPAADSRLVQSSTWLTPRDRLQPESPAREPPRDAVARGPSGRAGSPCCCPWSRRSRCSRCPAPVVRTPAPPPSRGTHIRRFTQPSRLAWPSRSGRRQVRHRMVEPRRRATRRSVRARSRRRSSRRQFPNRSARPTRR